MSGPGSDNAGLEGPAEAVTPASATPSAAPHDPDSEQTVDGRAHSQSAAAGASDPSAPPAPTTSDGHLTGDTTTNADPSAPFGRHELQAGPFRLSAVQRRLWKNGEEVVLTPTEWTLVKLLMEREGEGLSRDDILSAVWGRHFIGDLKIVDVNIRRIRQKIEDNPSHPMYIETLWGFGYRFNRGRA
ncbi:winged helix-turn-helix domain-containing protein [Paenibacillus methanolicus]|nr:winged helix-turn-helix domain-containing protein [Paenibacillus methanolicus]